MSAGAYVSVTIDISDVERGLRALASGTRSLTHAWQQVKGPMRDDQKEHAKSKSGPESSWPARAASTTAHHKKLPRRLLGRLPTAVSYKAMSNAVTGTSKIAWSEVHQEGGTVGHGARLPARPFLWISDKLLDLAGEVLASALIAAWGRP